MTTFEESYGASKFLPPLSFENKNVSLTTLQLIIAGNYVASSDFETISFTNELAVNWLIYWGA